MHEPNDERPLADRFGQPTTTLPCPPWCVLARGHVFYSALHDGTLMRFHEAADRRLTFDDNESVAVAVAAAEYVQRASGPVVWTDPPRIGVWGLERARR